jgi:hypothetical protein
MTDAVSLLRLKLALLRRRGAGAGEEPLDNSVDLLESWRESRGRHTGRPDSDVSWGVYDSQHRLLDSAPVGDEGEGASDDDAGWESPPPLPLSLDPGPNASFGERVARVLAASEALLAASRTQRADAERPRSPSRASAWLHRRAGAVAGDAPAHAEAELQEDPLEVWRAQRRVRCRTRLRTTLALCYDLGSPPLRRWTATREPGKGCASGKRTSKAGALPLTCLSPQL